MLVFLVLTYIDSSVIRKIKPAYIFKIYLFIQIFDVVLVILLVLLVLAGLKSVRLLIFYFAGF